MVAGITDIVIVTGTSHRSLEEHFDHNFELEDHLRKSGKPELVSKMKRIADMANFIYIRQEGSYGNGTPCWNARKVIGREPFVYAFGDDLVLAKKSFTKQMVQAYQKHRGLYVGAQVVPKSEVHKYGIIKPKGQGPEISGIVEKPDLKTAPSKLAAIGRFILEPEIFAALEKVGLGKGRELWLVDAIHYLIKQGQKAYYKKVQDGKWYTTGDPVSYLNAVRAYAQSRPEFKSKVKHIFR